MAVIKTVYLYMAGVSSKNDTVSALFIKTIGMRKDFNIGIMIFNVINEINIIIPSPAYKSDKCILFKHIITQIIYLVICNHKLL